MKSFCIAKLLEQTLTVFLHTVQLTLKKIYIYIYNVLFTNDNVNLEQQGPVVQSIVSLTSSLRGQLVKCFMTLLPNTLIFFVEKMREA